MTTNKNKYVQIVLSGGWIGVHASSMINEVIRTISDLLTFLLQKNIERTKMQIKPKTTNKTKISEQKTKATGFCTQKPLRGGKLFILLFLKKIEIVLITSFTIILLFNK